jgi:preprotein translocase SecE subunit
VARDRKRAKQRRARRDTAAAGRGHKDVQAPPPSQPVRADLPGALAHASGDVDEFDAALIRGAGGVPATPETGSETGPPGGLQTDSEPAIGAGADELQFEGVPPGGGRPPDGGGGDGPPGDGSLERPSGAPLRGGNRAVAFLRASWAELQRVQWPDRRQVTQATAVVLGFVAIAGAYLGLADFVAKEIVEFVL